MARRAASPTGRSRDRRPDDTDEVADHWRGKRDGGVRIPFTHVRGNSFSNTLLEAPTIAAESRFYDCVGDAPFRSTARHRRDRGEGAHGGRPRGADVRATGPEPLTYAEMRGGSGGTRAGDRVREPPRRRARRAAEAAGLPARWREFSAIYGEATARAAARGRPTRSSGCSAARPAPSTTSPATTQARSAEAPGAPTRHSRRTT